MSESYTKTDGTDGQREALETLYETMQYNELERQIADKNKALEEAHVRAANLEVERDAALDENKKLKAEVKTKVLDSQPYKDLLFASQQQEERIKELEEIEAKRVAEKDFVTAKEMQQPAQIWLQGREEATRIFAELRKCIADPKAKAFFEVEQSSAKIIRCYTDGSE